MSVLESFAHRFLHCVLPKSDVCIIAVVWLWHQEWWPPELKLRVSPNVETYDHVWARLWILHKYSWKRLVSCWDCSWSSGLEGRGLLLLGSLAVMALQSNIDTSGACQTWFLIARPAWTYGKRNAWNEQCQVCQVGCADQLPAVLCQLVLVHSTCTKVTCFLELPQLLLLAFCCLLYILLDTQRNRKVPLLVEYRKGMNPLHVPPCRFILPAFPQRASVSMRCRNGWMRLQLSRPVWETYLQTLGQFDARKCCCRNGKDFVSLLSKIPPCPSSRPPFRPSSQLHEAQVACLLGSHADSLGFVKLPLEPSCQGIR